MASLSTWVQFVRNFACNVKTLTPSSVWFSRGQLLGGKVSLLEAAAIAPTQYLAVLFNAQAGLDDLFHGAKAVLRFHAWSALVAAHKKGKGAGDSDAELIVHTSIAQNLIASYLRVLQGLIQIAFAVCFGLLGTNTLKGAGFFEGKAGQAKLERYVIDGLLVMDIGLLYFLWVMWSKFVGHVVDSTRCNKLAELLDSKDDRDFVSESLCDVALEAGYKPSSLPLLYSQVTSDNRTPTWLQPVATPTATLLLQCFEEVEDNLDTFAERRASSQSSKDKNGSVSASKLARSNAAYKLRLQAFEGSSAAPLDLVYFVLNFIAGYGYLLGILAYYFPGQNAQWHRVLKFGLGHDASSWWGNLAGDVAWTLEPLLVIAFAYLAGPSVSSSSSASAAQFAEDTNVKGSVRFAVSTPGSEGKSRGRLANAPTPWKTVGSTSKGSRSRSPAARSKSPGKRGGGSGSKVKKA